MSNGSKFAKAVALWVAIVYVVCTVLVAIAPGLAETIAKAGFHGVAITTPNITAGSVLTGLVWWVVAAYIGAALFAALYKKGK